MYGSYFRGLVHAAATVRKFVTDTDTADNILQFISEIQANPGVINYGYVGTQSESPVDNWNVTADPSNPSAANITTLEILDSDYSFSGGPATPILTLAEAASMAAGEEYELTDSVDGLQVGMPVDLATADLLMGATNGPSAPDSISIADDLTAINSYGSLSSFDSVTATDVTLAEAGHCPRALTATRWSTPWTVSRRRCLSTSRPLTF